MKKPFYETNSCKLPLCLSLFILALLFCVQTHAKIPSQLSTPAPHQSSSNQAPADSLKAKTISGTVRDKSTGETLPGVYIIIQQGNKKIGGTTTDAKGKFHLRIPGGADALAVSFIGYKSKLIIMKDDIKFNIGLESEVQKVEDVVVTGIFNKPKESFTGAVTFISKEDLQEFRSANVLTTIANVDPAFVIADGNEFGSNPNRMPEITIRGSSSVPLNVSDVQNNERANLNTPLFILDGFEITLQRMLDLEQEEIESVTILKDASSTALYGSRGANGVVVLTSVKPKEGKLRLSVSGGLNLEIPDLSSYNMLNASEKLALEKEVGLYQSDAEDAINRMEENRRLENEYNEKLQSILEGTDTYWLSQPLRIGTGTNARASISGGNTGFRYSLSGSINQIKGVMIGSDRTNFNGSANITYQLNEFSLTNTITTGINSSTESPYGYFSDYVTMNPYWRPNDENGDPIKKYNHEIGLAVLNPLYVAQLSGYDENGYTNIRNTTSVRWKPNNHFEFQLRGGISTNMKESNKFKPAQHPDYEFEGDAKKKGEYNFSTGKNNAWDIAFTGNYGTVIDKHRISAGLDFNLREGTSYNFMFDMMGYTHERLNFLSMAAAYKGDSPKGGESKGRAVGATFDLNYNYNNTAYISGSYRLDGASSFGKHNRFKPFYSIGAGITVSQLRFFADNIHFVNTFRIRYNYGVTGALQFNSPYQALSVYNYNPTFKYDGDLGAQLAGLANDKLTWQMDYSHNLGADLGFFNNKLSVGINFYRKITRGLTARVPLPLTNGFEAYTSNKGDVLNEGYDLSLSYTIIQNRSQQFRWSVRAGVANNRNELLKLSEEMKRMSAKAEDSEREDPNYLYQEGESMDALYVIPSLGIDPATGQEIFIDIYGNPTYDRKRAKRRNYGLMKPKITSNFSTSISYKGFRATASFAIRYGGQIYNSTLMNRVEGANITQNVDRRVKDLRWRKPGDYAAFLGLKEKYEGRQTSRFVQDDNSLAFKSLNIGYTLPKKWLKKIGVIKSLSCNASINDIFYLSTVKRERGTQYPYAIAPRFRLSMTL